MIIAVGSVIVISLGETAYAGIWKHDKCIHMLAWDEDGVIYLEDWTSQSWVTESQYCKGLATPLDDHIHSDPKYIDKYHAGEYD